MILKIALYCMAIFAMLRSVSAWLPLVRSHPSPFAATAFRAWWHSLHSHGKGELMTRYFRLTVILLGLFALHCITLARVSADDQFFDANGVRIRYVDQGSGPPVVLIHGFSGSLDTGWVETGVLPHLATDYRVIALDCRGHVKSDKPHHP